MSASKLQGVAGIAVLFMGSTGANTARAQQAPPAAAQGQQTGTGGTPADGSQNGAQTNPTAPTASAPVQNDTTGNPSLPQAPAPNHPGPLFLRQGPQDFTHLKRSFPNPIAPYTSTNYPAPRLGNVAKLGDLLRDGKLYLSLPDAVLLALENNYDIAIARVNLDIADTDLLRAQSGGTLRGVSTGLITNTLGGTSSTVTGGGGPGGTATGAGGAGAGANGLVLTTLGSGPLPLNFDPVLSGTLQYERVTTPGGSSLGGGSTTSGTGGTGTGTGTGGTGTGGTGGTGGGGTGGTGGSGGTGSGGTGTVGNLFNSNPVSSATALYDFQYAQGFVSGTSLNVTFNNSRQTSTSTFSSYSPSINSSFRATVTQQLLQGFGPGIQGRFIVQAKNDRRIADSAFRQQLIYTITQVESIYWSLVSAYEDVQAKTRALAQSSQLASDNRKQLQIGTLAPLDVINSDQAVSTDRQSLTTSQSNLEYQQLLMKQAIVRDLNEPQLSSAPVVPTDRVSLARLPEEDRAVEDLVKEAYANNPSIEQASINMENNKIAIKAERNGLLPIVNAYGFYGGSGAAGTANPTSSLCNTANTLSPFPPNCGLPGGGYGNALGRSLNNSNPDYGVGGTLNITIRNRALQADQARSQMEYRQAEMRLQQLYTQVRIQVINNQYALTNDRASVNAAQAVRDFQAQSLDAEQKKYRLGASTTANVLQQERNLATAENNLITATAAYANDRAALAQILSNTLTRYNIDLVQAASGTMASRPAIPGLTAPQAPAPPKPLTSTPEPLAPMNGQPSATPGAASPDMQTNQPGQQPATQGTVAPLPSTGGDTPAGAGQQAIPQGTVAPVPPATPRPTPPQPR